MIAEIPAVLMRGGTSKCWVFEEHVLPEGREARSRFLLRAYGAPDLRQADGVGGGTAFTNKVVIVKKSDRPDADVDYTHAQVDYTKPNVDWNGTCGNCSSVPGPYAIHAGWVQPAGDVTRVRIYNTNTDKFVIVDVPTPNGVVAEEGDTYIDGVPFPGPLVRLGFHRPAGSVTGKLFPSGRPMDEVETPFGRVRFTLVDAANPFVFALASDLGMTGDETVAELDNADTLARLEYVRGAGSVLMGLADRPENAAGVSQAVPKIGYVAPAKDATSGIRIRMLSMARPHAMLQGTALVALAAAVAAPGTTVAQVVGSIPEMLRVAHPSGIATVWPELDGNGELETAFVVRSARRLCAGTLFVPLPAESHNGVDHGAERVHNGRAATA